MPSTFTPVPLVYTLGVTAALPVTSALAGGTPGAAWPGRDFIIGVTSRSGIATCFAGLAASASGDAASDLSVGLVLAGTSVVAGRSDTWAWAAPAASSTASRLDIAGSIFILGSPVDGMDISA
jgi:hypothetical protein